MFFSFLMFRKRNYHKLDSNIPLNFFHLKKILIDLSTSFKWLEFITNIPLILNSAIKQNRESKYRLNKRVVDRANVVIFKVDKKQIFAVQADNGQSTTAWNDLSCAVVFFVKEICTSTHTQSHLNASPVGTPPLAHLMFFLS